MAAPTGFSPIGPRNSELGFVDGVLCAKFPGEKFFNPIVGGTGVSVNTAVQYVSPNGHDNNDGLTWETPKKTGWVAYASLQANKGGYMYLADGCSWVDNDNLLPGQVQDQGAWTYGPGAEAGPGFQFAQWPVIVYGVGSGSSGGLPTPFQRPGCAHLFAGSNLPSDGRTKPAIWKVMTQFGPEFHNIELVPRAAAANGCRGNYYAIRDGWNYNRNSDGSIMYQAVSSSTRSSGQTTHTVSLSAAATIESIARVQTSGIPGSTDPNDWTTTIVMHGNTSGIGCLAPPWEIGTPIWLATSSPGFTSGAYITLSVNATQLGLNDWSVTIRDGGVTAVSASNPGTIRSVIASPGDLIDLESSNAQFPSTQYLVVSCSVTNSFTGTITVKDIYGGLPGISANFGPASNIGRVAHQQRSYYTTVASRYYNVNSRGPDTDTNDDAFFRFGPQFDVGAMTAFEQEFHYCYNEGYKPSVASGFSSYYDDRRMVAYLVQGGSVTTPGIIVRQCLGAKAGFRCVFSSPDGGGSTGLFDLDGFLTDCNNGEQPALYDIDATNSTDINIRSCFAADANLGYGAALNRIVGAQALKVRGDATATGPWASVAPEMGSSAVSGAGAGGSATGSPWVTPRRISVWTPDLQISGKHPAAWRQISPTSRRFPEEARTPANYTPAPASTGHVDPMGGNNADRWDDTAGIIYLHSFDHSFTFAAGDVIAVCGWVNASDSVHGFAGADNFLHVIAQGGTVVWNETGTNLWSKPAPIQAAGWQFVTFYNIVASASGTSNLQVEILGPAADGGGFMDLFGWSIAYIPASAGFSDADVGEWTGTLRSTPNYLPVGQAGTFEKQKFIAHGGLGVDASIKKTAGAGSGQLSLLGTQTYVPLYASDGTTIITWLRGEDATVNP